MLEFTKWIAGGDDISIAEWPRNCWLGVTAENQQRADERIPILLQIPAAIRFVSVEPMLGPVKLPEETVCLGCGRDIYKHDCGCPAGTGKRLKYKIDWVICGGESGPGARPMHPDWARSLRDQCQDAGVPFFFKQWGEYSVLQGEREIEAFHPVMKKHPYRGMFEGDSIAYKVGKNEAGRILDGRTWDEYPS